MSELTRAHLARLPFFPLPRLVFFPDTLLPLHVFEPRYREMTRFCLAERWPMAVVMIQPGYELGQPGDPPVLPVAGVGQIVGHEELPDGRFNVLLHGIARVRLAELADPVSYRVAQAEALPDVWPDDRGAMDRDVATLRGFLAGLSQRFPHAAGSVSRILDQDPTPDVLSNALPSLLFPDPGERQRLLETPAVAARIRSLNDRLTEILAASGSGDETIH